MAYLILFMKRQLITSIGIVTFAFALFQSFDNFVVFCRWVQPFVYFWRVYVYGALDYLLIFVPFTIPNVVKDTIIVAALGASLIFRVKYSILSNVNSNTDYRSRIQSGIAKFYWKSYYVPISVLVFFIMIPFVADEADDSDIFYNISFMLRIMISASLIAGGEFIKPRIRDLSPTERNAVFKLLGSEYAWSIVSVIIGMIVINFVGLYADSLEKFPDT